MTQPQPAEPLQPLNDWRVAFSALAYLVREEFGCTPLADLVYMHGDTSDERVLEAVRGAEAYWTAHGAKWTQP